MGGRGKCSERGEGPFHFLPLPRKRGMGRWGGGKIAQPLCSAHPAVRALSRRPATPSQRRELESLALGGSKGGASAHAHSENRGQRGGRREATSWPGGGEVLVPPSGGAFVLRPHLQSLRGFGSFSSQRGAAELPPVALPERWWVGGGEACVWAGRGGGRSERLAWGYWSGPPAHLCSLRL